MSCYFQTAASYPATGGQREKDPAVALQDLLPKRGEIPRCVRVARDMSGAGGSQIMSQQSRKRAHADGFG